MRIDQELFRSLGLDSTAIYPGHPITIAFCIMKAFPDYASAAEHPNNEAPAALASSRIPGAGGCVYNALQLLRSLRDGVSLKAAFEDADATWDRVDNHKDGGGSYAKDEASRERYLQTWKDGQAQADLIKPLFSGNEAWWQGVEPDHELRVV